MRPVSAAIILLLVSSLVATAGSAGVVASTGSTDNVEHAGITDTVVPAESEGNSTVVRSQAAPGELFVRTTFSLRDTGPDQIRVIKEYHVGSGVDHLTKTVHHPIQDVSTSRMSQSGGGSETTFRWTGSGGVARIEYVADAEHLGRPGNEYVGPQRAARGDGYAVVGATYDGLRSDANEWTGEIAVEGQGTAGETFAVLGPYDEYVAEVEEGAVRLVVPDHVRFDVNRTEVVEAIRETDAGIDAGVSLDPNATFLAVGHDIGEVVGITYSKAVDSEEWASDVIVHNSATGSRSFTWRHEAVHQRKQSYETDASAEWTVEGNAEYYPSLISWHQGEMTFDQFRREWDILDRHRNVRLSEPDTWKGDPISLSNYRKGGLVTAWLDAAIRNATDGERSYDDVLRRMNDHSGELTHEEFVDIVAEVGGSDLEPRVERYVTTDAVPPKPPENPYLYTDSGIDSDLSVEPADANGSLEMHPGGRLSIPVEVTNHGTDASVALGFESPRPGNWTFFAGGQYVDFQAVDGAEAGYFQVPPGETKTVRLYLVVPENASLGEYDYEVTARDLSGTQGAFAGTIEVVEQTFQGESEESEESAEPESLPPASTVGVQFDATSQLATTGANGTVPVYPAKQDFNVSPTFDYTNYSVDYVKVLVNGSEVQVRGGNYYAASEANVTYDLIDPYQGYRNVTVRVALENGGVVQRDWLVLFTAEPEVDVFGQETGRIGETETLEADVDKDYGEYEIRWLVDGERVGTGTTYEYEYVDGTQNVTAVVRDEFGATAHESVTFRGSEGPVTLVIESVRSIPVPVLAGAMLAVLAVGLLKRRLR
ncbi:M61 metallopeptidase family protein [Halorussus litoreus]|uniref:NEW3 domain-containing protein n=1 Tax=Halorussus litoreus TaxID=1710536 RepID=UPI000E27DA09|nr:NEW3 domain-containing protein [Halorussus litoreus]